MEKIKGKLQNINYLYQNCAFYCMEIKSNPLQCDLYSLITVLLLKNNFEKKTIKNYEASYLNYGITFPQNLTIIAIFVKITIAQK